MVARINELGSTVKSKQGSLISIADFLLLNEEASKGRRSFKKMATILPHQMKSPRRLSGVLPHCKFEDAVEVSEFRLDFGLDFEPSTP